MVKSIDSYIKDTTHFLCKIQSVTNLPSNTLLVTLDVTSLYTNIPHDEGIAACATALNTRQSQLPPTADLVTLITHILKKNSFEFGDRHYLQIHGTAMGTRMAPSYANLFMANLEVSFLACPSILKPLLWLRFIDDIFLIWTHGEECLRTFIGELNNFHRTIKFTAEWSHHSIPFLDTCVMLKDGCLTTDLHQKTTDTHQYLSFQSCHPRHCKLAIPYSQALRIRRICSSDIQFAQHTHKLKSHLSCRGYNPSFVQRQIDRASLIKREDALAPSRQTSKTSHSRAPLVITYHPTLPNFSAVLEKYQALLNVSPRLQKIFPEKPVIAYRRPRNLRDLLVRAQLTPKEFLPGSGTTPCGVKRCLTCKHIKTGTTVHSNHTGHCFKLVPLPPVKPVVSYILSSAHFAICNMLERHKTLSTYGSMVTEAT